MAFCPAPHNFLPRWRLCVVFIEEPHSKLRGMCSLFWFNPFLNVGNTFCKHLTEWVFQMLFVPFEKLFHFLSVSIQIDGRLRRKRKSIPLYIVNI